MKAGTEPAVGVRRGLTSATLESLFRETFFKRWNTLLLGGGEEPLYVPAGETCRFHRIVYRADYFASALHEVSHWCIAGSERRLLPDYGYWYEPDGRSPRQQAEFEAVEARPQALEWLFSVAAGHSFRPSVDNLGGEAGASQPFRIVIAEQARSYCRAGLPLRARLFAAALADCFAGADYLNPANYDPLDLN